MGGIPGGRPLGNGSFMKQKSKANEAKHSTKPEPALCFQPHRTVMRPCGTNNHMPSALNPGVNYFNPEF